MANVLLLGQLGGEQLLQEDRHPHPGVSGQERDLEGERPWRFPALQTTPLSFQTYHT